MKIGLAQFAPVLGDAPANRAAVERLVRRAAGADLLVLPELCNSGYNFESPEAARAVAEPVRGGPFVDHLARLCAELGLSIVSGLCERDGDRLYNSAVLVTPRGVEGHYRKLHLFLNEKDIFTPGDLGLPVFDLRAGSGPGSRTGSDVGLTRDAALTGGAGAPAGTAAAPDRVRVGILICFDWQFPETWRVLALRGADIVCHPSNLVLPGKAQKSVPLHAMLNRVFVALANRTGTERGLRFTGESIIVAPSGEVLARASEEDEEVLLVEIDPAEARNKQVTARNDLIKDRRPEWYGPIVE